MNRKLRILQIIVQDKIKSGGAIQMYLLSKELVKMGHYVCAVYNKNEKFKDDFAIFENSVIDLCFFDMDRIKLNKRSFSRVKKIRKFIQDGNFDIIHAHKGNAVDLVWLSTVGLKVNIVTNRGVIIPLNYFQSFKYRTKKVKRIIAVAQAVKDIMVKTGAIDPKKIDVVFGSVDTEKFKPGILSTLKSEYSIPDDKRVIGFVGNASLRKGLKYLFEAFESLSEKYRELLLMLVGVSTDELKNYNIKKDLMNKIIPTGFRKDVPNCMACFDIFVFPGYKDEGLTGTIREAAAMGLPIVTADVAGNKELIHNEQNGLVVPIKNSEKLAEAMELLLKNDEKAVMFGENAREYVVEKMSNEVRARNIEKIYFDILLDS